MVQSLFSFQLSTVIRLSNIDHRQITFSIEGMLVILHQGDQHGFGYISFVVRLPPVQIEIIHPGTLELTLFTMEGLYFVVDITDVFLQLTQCVEGLLTLGTRLCFLSGLDVLSPNVSHQAFSRPELHPTLFTIVLFVLRVNTFNMAQHVRFMLECSATVSAENSWF